MPVAPESQKLQPDDLKVMLICGDDTFWKIKPAPSMELLKQKHLKIFLLSINKVSLVNAGIFTSITFQWYEYIMNMYRSLFVPLIISEPMLNTFMKLQISNQISLVSQIVFFVGCSVELMVDNQVDFICHALFYLLYVGESSCK